MNWQRSVAARWKAAVCCALCWTAASGVRASEEGVEHVVVFQEALIEWDKSLADGTVRDDHRVLSEGQTLERRLTLPPLPANQREAKRIMATLLVEPVIQEENGKLRPGDPWTRLGTVSVVLPNFRTDPDAPLPEVEIMRFITGFGGAATFTQDVSDLAPLLHGEATLRVFISTYKQPAWKATLTLEYHTEPPGYRRPVFAMPVFNEPMVTAENSTISATVEVPPGLARPRLRFLSTGHATDGTGGDEFISRTHVLRINGNEVARWRPWREDLSSREANPMSGRIIIDGRELWSSDLDRSGWRPGTLIEPLRMPVPELTPGKHTIELQVLNIRPKDQFEHHGYWRVSCIAVADEPWPEPGQTP